MDNFVEGGSGSDDKRKLAEFRAAALAEAKAAYDAKQQAQERERKRKAATGEDTYIAASIEQRIGKKDKSSRHRSHSDKKKHKKHKKEKHKSKKHKKDKHKDDKGSSSGSDSDDQPDDQEAKQASEAQPAAQRDDWMTGALDTSGDFFSSLGTVSKAPPKPKEDPKPKLESGQHSRELNPFWKDGGTGLPPEKTASSAGASPAGASWKERAMGKLRESAKQQGRDIDVEMRRKNSFKEQANREVKRSTSSSRMLRPSAEQTGWQSASNTASPFGSRTASPAYKPKPSAPADPDDEGADMDTRADRRGASPAAAASEPELTETELNAMAAEAMRAEIMGESDKAKALNEKIAAARARAAAAKSSAAQQPQEAGRSDRKDVLLVRTSRSGMAVPARSPSVGASGLSNRFQRERSKLGQTHDKEGQRERFFQDDDESQDVRRMYQQEVMGMGPGVEEEFMRLAGRHGNRVRENEDYSVDDVFVDRAARKQSKGRQEQQERQRVVNDSRRLAKTLESCQFCINDSEAFQKQLLLSLGVKTYLALPDRGSLCDGHCLIVPVNHVTSTRGADEDVWEEIQMFQRCLVNMFKAEGKDVVFLETVMNLKRQWHTVMHCVPLDAESGELAPMYFKKAIQECDQQWSDNPKLVDTRKKGFRSSIPTGFPYFYVAFGLDEGFAHVIEDEQIFPRYFGQEIVGNMLDVPARTWLKPQKDPFPVIKQRSVEFLQKWKKFDWTADLEG